MNTFEEIRLAVARLSYDERRNLAVWIHYMADMEGGVSESPAAQYASQRRFLSVDEYLKLEETSPIRHEYIAGEVFAMAGATKRHNVICMNVVGALVAHLRGGPCRAYMETIKVRLTVKEEDVVYYPDVLVACGAQDLEKSVETEPKLIVEVLSPSTERIDRREKALNYREIPTLEEYVLIAQGKPEVAVYRRSQEWRAQILVELEAAVEFQAIGMSLPLDCIYEGVSLTRIA